MPSCPLDASAGDYEIKAYTKCSSWKGTNPPTMQLAMYVAGVSRLRFFFSVALS